MSAWRFPLLASLLGVALAAGCRNAPLVMPSLATAEISSDFDTYRLRRVGLLPFEGESLDIARARMLQQSFQAELSRSTPFEVVMLASEDLEEVELSEPHRRGWYSPRTIIALSRRYSLDGILFGTVTQERSFPPQSLSLQTDLVSAETGLVIWSASVHLDANDPRVEQGLQVFYGADRVEGVGTTWHLGLISPERFARFAAFQVACLL